MTAPLVRVRELRVRFGAVTAVDGVSFDIGRGECVALVGESGSGKSVTARSLLGLAGRGAAVSAERAELDGVDVRGFTERQWRRVRGARVGLVLQDALVALDPLRPVGSEVREALTVRGRGGRSRHELRERVVGLLAATGVTEPELRTGQYPHQLSGGLRQRALIASALAQEPDLLVVDEPTTALDRTVAATVLRLLAALPGQGRSVLLVSHDLAAVGAVADRVLVMDAGRIVEAGPTAAILGAPRHAVTRRLVDAQPRPPAEPAPAPEEPEPGERPAVLDLREVTARFTTGGGRTALDAVSLRLHRGEVLGVVGESGSGKTTLARVALGLVAPDAGAVLLDGDAWSGVAERRRRGRRARIQFVAQDPLSAFDPLWTVERIVGEAFGSRTPRATRRARVRAALQEVRLGPEVLSRRPAQLSGGQRQRVAIARALATDPQVLVCDEPVSALDTSVQATVLDLLAGLRRARGLAILFISHDLGVVRRLCDRVVVLRAARVLEEGPVDEVFRRPRHPYTRELVEAIPGPGAGHAAPESQERHTHQERQEAAR